MAAFFATGYYAAARPAEGLGLREDDCTLPKEGWGVLMLGESRPAAGKRWTDSGEVHDRRGLKHRGAKDVRPVPIPPVLVRILRAHLDKYGTGPDGRLFSLAERRSGFVVHLLPSVGRRSPVRAHACPGGFAARWSAVRPAARCGVALAQRWCSGYGGGRAGRALGGRAVEGLREVHRRPAGDDQQDDRSPL